MSSVPYLERGKVKDWAKRHANLLVFLGSTFLILSVLGGMESVLRFGLYKPKVVKTDLEEFVQADPLLSYRPKPNVSMTEVCTRDGEEIYRAVYSMDEWGRRITPVPGSSSARPCLALFFGCSFTLGMGVQDDESLPSQFALYQDNLLPINYGFGGWGPQQMWLLLNRPDFNKELPPSQGGVAFFVFINDHIARLMGTNTPATNWKRPRPWLHMVDGRVVHSGTLRDRSPFKFFCMRCAAAFRLVRFARENIFPGKEDVAVTPEAADLIVHMMKEATERARALNMEFCFVVFPGSDYGTQLVPLLEENGVKCLDYCRLFSDKGIPTRDLWLRDSFQLEFGHPNAAAYRLLAEQLAKDVPRLFPALAGGCRCIQERP